VHKSVEKAESILRTNLYKRVAVNKFIFIPTYKKIIHKQHTNTK